MKPIIKDILNVEHRFHSMLKQGMDFLNDQHEDANTAWDYYDGKQWLPEEINDLESRYQQASVINICSIIVNMFIAVERQRQTDYNLVGVEESDDQHAEVLTQLLHNVLNNSDFDHYLSEIARDGVIGGIGWLEVFMNEDINTGENNIEIAWRPWEEIVFDPHARKPDKSDSRWIIRRIWMDRDEVEEQWPDKADSIQEFFNDSVISKFHGQEEEARVASSDSIYIDPKMGTRRICIHECYYRTPDRKTKYVVFVGGVFLEGDQEDDSKNSSPYKFNDYTFIPFQAKRDKMGRPLGILKDIIPLNDTLNKSMSKWLWNTSSNKLFHETGALFDPEAVKEEVNNPNAVIELNEGGLSKIQLASNLPEATHQMSMMQFIIQMAQRISGVNDASVGFAGVNARSGIQEGQRAFHGSMIQTPVIENLYFTKKRLAKIVLLMIGQFYTKKRVLRLVGPDKKVSRVTINDSEDEESFIIDMAKVLRYDLEIKEELPFTTARELANRTLSEIMKSNPQLADILILPLLENMAFRDKERIIKMVSDKMQVANEREAFENAGLSPQLSFN